MRQPQKLTRQTMIVLWQIEMAKGCECICHNVNLHKINQGLQINRNQIEAAMVLVLAAHAISDLPDRL